MISPRTFATAANLAWQLAVLVAILLAILGVRPGQVSGYSMEPRIASDEFVLINALAYRLSPPARGDIVAFHHLRTAPAIYLKRVIGIPGDRVRIDRGTVYVNDRPLVEPYVGDDDDRRSFPSVVVPAGSYYVLGDNRARSDDSRAWGFVAGTDLIGRAMLAVWPPARIGPLK